MVHDSRQQCIYTSTIAGGITGSVFNAFQRGSRGFLTAVLLYGGLGGIGEWTHLAITSPKTSPKESHVPERIKESDKSVWRRLKESSPLRPIPDAEFESLMMSRVQDLDEQIRLVDEEIRLAKECIDKV